MVANRGGLLQRIATMTALTLWLVYSTDLCCKSLEFANFARSNFDYGCCHIVVHAANEPHIFVFTVFFSDIQMPCTAVVAAATCQSL